MQTLPPSSLLGSPYFSFSFHVMCLILISYCESYLGSVCVTSLPRALSQVCLPSAPLPLTSRGRRVLEVWTNSTKPTN
ncbi:hypothetical protein F4776DRAFT_649848 [Hypoxylon sp. NC0597]|nr:hypothetical protein F4776DRAFT_649848 [Hypoxylon sp. NC0597]